MLVDDDLHALTDGPLLDRAAELIRERNRIGAELTRTVRVADARQACEHDGLKTMPSWLRNHPRLSAAAAAELVRSGRALEHLPCLTAAFAAGDVTGDQVAAVAPIARDDHLVKWINGGDTPLENSALLCERHHTKVHHGFRVERRPDGRWRTWRPDGTEISIGPSRTGPPLVTAA